MAFAANSVFGRLALVNSSIDAASFTAIRLSSASVVLLCFLFLRRYIFTNSRKQHHSKTINARGSWWAAFMLFGYAASFSFAYGYLDAGSGALILFGMVQITLFGMSVFHKTKISVFEWCGALLALLGLFVLVLPALSSPAFIGVVLMVVSGLTWGGYTYLGRGSDDALGDTAWNFFRTLPLVLVFSFVFASSAHVSGYGVVFAGLSGAFASAGGYAVWYMVLPQIKNTIAAVSQLSVPVLAAMGGAVFISEPVSSNLIFATVLVSGGVLLVVFSNTLVRGVASASTMSKDKGKI